MSQQLKFVMVFLLSLVVMGYAVGPSGERRIANAKIKI